MPGTVKRIALFLDGTWNNVNVNTNVWRLKMLCVCDAEQLVYYSPGVGTNTGEHLSGGMFGIGINKEVTDAYEWLIEHYQPGAQLFIFGFSRGAFTARSLAGFIAKCGLLQPGSPVSLDEMFARYRKGTATSILKLQTLPESELSQEDRLIKVYSQSIPIWFQGVWDTVGSLGVPLPLLPNVSHDSFAFLETDLRINDTHAYHAIAVDEHRKAFSPTLWVKNTPNTGACPPPRDLAHVEQRWFVGAHADVGGGYANDLLPEIPFRWMLEKAKGHGLVFSHDAVIDGDVNASAVHDSYGEMGHGIYKLLTLGQEHYRTIGAEPAVSEQATTTTINETIDASVFHRWRSDANYRPKNLTEWAKRRKVDPAAIQDAVRASDASVLPADESPQAVAPA